MNNELRRLAVRLKMWQWLLAKAIAARTLPGNVRYKIMGRISGAKRLLQKEIIKVEAELGRKHRRVLCITKKSS